MSYFSIETSPSSLNQVKVKIPSTLRMPKIEELSKPRIKHKEFEEIVGPGRYEYRDGFLSGNFRCPSVTFGRSERFLKTKISRIKKETKILEENSLSSANCCLSDIVAAPKYSFNRTGHNLDIIKNRENPGVGRYSPNYSLRNSSFVFGKAQKRFEWKKGNW